MTITLGHPGNTDHIPEQQKPQNTSTGFRVPTTSASGRPTTRSMSNPCRPVLHSDTTPRCATMLADSQYFIQMTTVLGIEVWGSRSLQVDSCGNAASVCVVAKDIATTSPADKESRTDLTCG